MKVFTKGFFDAWMMFIGSFDDRVTYFASWDVMTWSIVLCKWVVKVRVWVSRLDDIHVSRPILTSLHSNTNQARPSQSIPSHSNLNYHV